MSVTKKEWVDAVAKVLQGVQVSAGREVLGNPRESRRVWVRLFKNVVCVTKEEGSVTVVKALNEFCESFLRIVDDGKEVADRMGLLFLA